MAIACDPASDNGVAILKNLGIFAHLLEGGVEQFHQLLGREVLRDVTDVKLPF